ncbi:MAG: GTPase/DUF3482 domain-containing protein [Phycisphaerales bacterium]|nr:GTPase/DUF3482 domain-containing protein [Phycisphaerales bacterium]MCI0630467.1 GTPase/DUF3482 domain-containing protein [Phycisphaerales bacterium]
MTRPALKIAVVGHTNTGKTSLLRTLTRDVDFGEVSDRPATTRQVEGTTLVVDGRDLIELYDTPGLEDSIALLDHLNALSTDRRSAGIDLVNRFLSDREAVAGGRFAQEAKAIRQVLASDLALYVIDARDRVLGKHRDELEILARCAKPVVPVLNFIASPEAQTAVWREHLSRAGMHAVAEFDTVVLDEQSEIRLLEILRTLLDRHQGTFNALIDERRRQRDHMVRASAALVADLMIDVSAYAVNVPLDDQEQVQSAVNDLKQRVREREQRCVEQLLDLHRFRLSDFQPGDLPLTEGRWGVDLFSPAALKQFGVRTGGAAAAGAMIGLTVDAMVGGMSLGAATATGAAIGAVLGAGQAHAKRLIERLRGRTELRCDDNTLRLLLTRQANLVYALLRRGHASMTPIRLGSDHQRQSAMIEPPRRLPHELGEAKLRPQWSHLTVPRHHTALTSQSRRAVQHRLTDQVYDIIQQANRRV